MSITYSRNREQELRNVALTMSLSFLILLLALVTSYISQQLVDADLTTFWGLASVVSWILSLVSAPWQLQFLLLILLLFRLE